LRRKDDKAPEVYWAQKTPELQAELLDEFYKLKGWNKEGIPTRESLRELGLDYVSQDFIERGILKESGKLSPNETETEDQNNQEA
jgi:benzoyl-CoA reductase subunit BamB